MILFFMVLLTGVLTLFSVGVMSFISMTAPVGPWIDVPLVLVAMLLVRFFYRGLSTEKNMQLIGYSSAAGAVGGSIATACGFAFPTLYFLNNEIFINFLTNPPLFIGLMAALILCAGGLGMFIAHVCAPRFLMDPTMSFPIGQMTYSLMSVTTNIRKSYELFAGLITAGFFNLLQAIFQNIPKKIILLKESIFYYWSFPQIAIRPDWVFMLVAIGFVTGHVIALPLLVGVLIKFLAADPVHTHLFSYLAPEDFFFAFCAGIMLHSTCVSFIELPRYMYNFFKKSNKNAVDLINGSKLDFFQGTVLLVLLVGTSLFFYFFNFSLISQSYVLIIAALFTYQIAIIGGKTGLAPVGRFATWLMFPYLFLFGFDPVQVTIIATFMEISGMVVVDVLFGRKMAEMAQLDTNRIALFQFFGLLLSSLVVAGVFWFLISHFGLGVASPLIAQRCQARALLINVSHFDYIVMGIGIVCGFLLKFLQVNPTMVLGGLLLPIDFSLLLIAGGLLTYLVKDRENYTAYWSGVFAASALCMLIKALA